jgi:hypothetical protein
VRFSRIGRLILNDSDQTSEVSGSPPATNAVACGPCSVRFLPSKPEIFGRSGLEIDKHFADDLSTISVWQKVRKCKVEHYLKKDNAYRDIDLHSSVVKMLKQFIGSRTSGFLFASRHGRPISNSNILNRHLHPSLKELGWSDPKTGHLTAGNHAFRRFRNTFLRKSHVPDDLIQFWLGHAGKGMTDECSHVRDDLKYRKMVAEQIGIGFELRSQTRSVVPNVPKTGVEASQ